jgi:hypothetical protein
VLKWFKAILAVLLLPVCVGAAWALVLVFQATGNAESFWVATLSGAACWLVIYILLPKPMWVYVLGHELTHALWVWLSGGRVKKFKVSSRGGHVVVTRSHFGIALAPYFFPLYAVLVVAVFAIGQNFWDWRPYLAWFHLLLGAAYAFHITLTWHILHSDQTDISEQGYLFSFVVIFLGNIVILLLGLPLLASRVNLVTALKWWAECTGLFVQKLIALFH